MDSLLAILIGFSLALGAPGRMRPRVLLNDASHCDAVMIHDRHIVVEQVCVRGSGNPKNGFYLEVTWDGQVAGITDADEKASEEWIRARSLLPRLSIKHHDLYWDGKKIALGKVDVTDLYHAIPWEGGVLIYGRTFPRRGFFESWPFKGHFIEARDIEPFCAIFFDLETLRGEDLWLSGKAMRPFLVFPLPAPLVPVAEGS